MDYMELNHYRLLDNLLEEVLEGMWNTRRSFHNSPMGVAHPLLMDNADVAH